MNSYPTVSIGVVIYGGEKYLSQSIPSLLDVDYQGKVEFLFLDYGPDFSAEEETKKYIPKEKEKSVKFLRSSEKMWHSGGHNFCIRKATGEYYVCASNDMLYDKNFLTPLVDALQNDHHFSSATGKLLFWGFEGSPPGEGELEKVDIRKTTTIDSLGLRVFPYQRCIDIAQKADECVAPTEKKEIFGASGALGIYRKIALKKAAHTSVSPAQYFDENLHYKDDVDLAYRLQWAGERCLFVPESRVWHHRQLGKKTKKTRFQKENSAHGFFTVIIKNVFRQGFSPIITLQTSVWALLTFFHMFLTFGKFKTFSSLYKTWKQANEKKMDMPKNVSVQRILPFFKNNFLPYKK